MRLSLDANVLVYAVDVDAGIRHLRAAELLRRAALVDCFLTLQTLGEFFNVVTRKAKLSEEKAQHSLQSWRNVFPVCAATIMALDEALRMLRRHRIPFWDAMLWATAHEAGCDFLLTEDLQDGRRLGRVTFVNPFDPANDGLIERLLSPAKF